MFGGNIIRRLTGAVRNGVVWGAAWFALAMGVFGVLWIVKDNPVSWLDAIGMSLRIGVAGGLTGGAFSAFISFFYRGKRLSDISPTRFAIGGAIVAGLVMLAWLGLGNLFAGGQMPPWGDIDEDLLYATLFGGISAGASMWLAQRAPAGVDGSAGELDRLQAGDQAGAFNERTATVPESQPVRR